MKLPHTDAKNVRAIDISSDRGHAKYAPSYAKVWMHCPAAVPMLEELKASGDYVDDAGLPAKRGLVMHAMAEGLLKGEPWPEDADSLYLQAYGDPYTRMAPHEWQPHVKGYVEYVNSLLEDAREEAEDLWVEPPVLEIESLAKIFGDDCWGSVDTHIAVVGGTLHVIDLKTGRRPVSPVENEQMMLYTSGVAEAHGNDFARYKGHIFQRENPEGPALAWEASPDVVRAFREKAVRSIEESKAPAPACVTGPHCNDCKVGKLGRCPAQIRAAAAVFDADTVDGDLEDFGSEASRDLVVAAPVRQLTVGKLTDGELGVLLSKVDAIESLVKALRKEGMTRALEGSPPPGTKLIESRTNRRWRKDMPEAELAEALKDLGVEPWVPKLTTLSAAESWAGKGRLDHLIEKPPGSPKLVSESTKGKPYAIGAETMDDGQEDDFEE